MKRNIIMIILCLLILPASVYGFLGISLIDPDSATSFTYILNCTDGCNGLIGQPNWGNITQKPFTYLSNNFQVNNDTLFVNTTNISMSVGDATYLRLDATNDPLTGPLNITHNNFFGTAGISIKNTNQFGTSTIGLISETGQSTANFLCAGSGIPQAADQCGFFYSTGERTFQVMDTNVTKNMDASFDWGFIPEGDGNFDAAVFGLRLVPAFEENGSFKANLFLQGDLLLQDPNGNKRIRTVQVDGGRAMVFDSNESLIAGGFPFVYVARSSLGERIVPSWIQNGRNNSFSGQMNSWVAVPKSWVIFTGSDDTEGVEFLFNASDYPNYCNYLQDNLSLIPEGCKYFADTQTRLVPLVGAGDLEVVRTATIHEGMTIYKNVDFISRNGNDFDMLWTDINAGGKLHVRNTKTIEANITFFDQVVATFDSTLLPFVSESVAPEPGRDWRITIGVPSECFNDNCATSNGGNEKVMAFSTSTTFQGGTVASSNSRMLFYISSSFAGGANFTITMDNHEGDTSMLYNRTTTVSNAFINISFPPEMENKSNVTTNLTLNAVGASNQVWIDQMSVTSIPAEAIIINETYEGGKITIGSDIDVSSECYIEVNKFVNNQTQETEPLMNFVCPNVAINGNLNISGGGGGGGTDNHAALFNLDFTNAGHTGFASFAQLDSLNTTVISNVASIGVLQTQVDLLNETKLNITDQRYNNTPEIFWDLTGSNVFTKDNSYNVGIGTSSPATKLDVHGNITLSDDLGNKPSIVNENGTIHIRGYT